MKSLAQLGSASIQMMVASALVIAGAGYVASTQLSSKKLGATVDYKRQFLVIKREIGEALIEDQICMATLSRQGALTASVTYDGVYNIAGEPMYEVGSILYGKKILGMRLEGYEVLDPNEFSIQEVDFVVELGNAAAAPSKIYGSTRSTQKIPLKISTYNNEMVGCSNSLQAEMLLALSSACRALGGTYNAETDRCSDLHGDSGPMMKFAREQLCGAEDGNCRHPYENKVCTGVDVRGVDWNNWVVSGFNQDTSMSCVCLPVACPDPASVCRGTDTGTDHCTLNCPAGTRDC